MKYLKLKYGLSLLKILDERNVKILCRKYSSYIFHVFSEARDHILILNISFFNKLRQIIPEIRSERRDFLISIFILKTMTNTQKKEKKLTFLNHLLAPSLYHKIRRTRSKFGMA
jgi:hypothetical protein